VIEIFLWLLANATMGGLGATVLPQFAPNPGTQIAGGSQNGFAHYRPTCGLPPPPPPTTYYWVGRKAPPVGATAKPSSLGWGAMDCK